MGSRKPRDASDRRASAKKAAGEREKRACGRGEGGARPERLGARGRTLRSPPGQKPYPGAPKGSSPSAEMRKDAGELSFPKREGPATSSPKKGTFFPGRTQRTDHAAADAEAR